MRKHWKLGVVAVLVAAVFAWDVSALVAKQHTKVVTRTVVRQAPDPKFTGLASLVSFLHPRSASQTKCPKGAPAGAVCVQMGSPTYYVFVAMAPDAAAS